MNATVAVYLDDVLVVPTQPTCSDATPCNLQNPKDGGAAPYRQIIGSLFRPAGRTTTLQILISRVSSPPARPMLDDTVLDLVTLTQVS